MIKVRLNQILDDQERTLKWLSTKTDLTYATLHRLANGKTSSISFETLDAICEVLHCDVSDILEFKKSKKLFK